LGFPALAPLKRYEQEEHAKHDGQIGEVEYSSVQRSGAEQDEIRNQAMMAEAVNEIAHASRPGQSEAKKGKPREV
jgi:hypothetical protein